MSTRRVMTRMGVRRPACRRLVAGLIALQVQVGVPAAAWTQGAAPSTGSFAFSPLLLGPAPAIDFLGTPPVPAAMPRVQTGRPLPAPRVTVNRTIPAVTAAPTSPVFSPEPTTAEIVRARVFAEPLVPVGGEPGAVENAALANALLQFHQGGGRAWPTTLGRFLADHPQSAWRASLFLNIGALEAQGRAYSGAMAAWDTAWALAKDATDTYGRAVADLAVAEWLTLAAAFGQAADVEARLTLIAGRPISGVAAVKIARARETIGLIKRYPDLTRFCGPEAVLALIEALHGPGAAVPSALASYRGSPDGTTLAELEALARQAGVGLQVIARTNAADLPVPSIVHWTIGHYATIVERQGDRYRIVDRARRETYWLPLDVLLRETSGYFLVLDEHAQVAGWRAASRQESESVRGSGPLCPDGSTPPAPPCYECAGGGAGGPGGSGPASGPGGGRPGFGMAVYQFEKLTASLLLKDTPVGYTPPRGPAVSFTLEYHQREWRQPQIFSYGNVGPKWSLELIRFVKEEPQVSSPSLTVPAHVWVTLPNGGREVFINPNGSGEYAAHWASRAALVLVSASPIRYERRLPDGTVEVYEQSDGAPAGSRRVFLTEIVDPHGQSLTFTWDGQLRLVAVTDALGQVSTIEYEDGAHPLQITSIVDPFDREATLTYNAAGQLESITDMMGLISRFGYGPEDFVSTLTTPYGTTTFHRDLSTEAASFSSRFIEATDPLGGTERVEWHYEHASLSATVASNEVPTGFTDWNERLNLRVSLYWDKLASAEAPGALSSAEITHWLEAPEWDSWQIYAMPIPHSVKRPLEGRVWYAYPGQPANKWLAGWWRQPSRVGRILDDGASQITEMTYNTKGMVLTRTDPLGRETTYTYDTNDVDLLTVHQTTGSLNDLLATYDDYTSLGQPETMIDAAGETTTYTYNSAGQVLTVTNPLSETTTYAYDTDGYLETVTGPVSGAVTSFTYDAYGRVRTVTGPDSYVTTTDYDVFDRPIRVTYPDSTYDETTYDKLDVATRRDRLGRLTRYYHDALRRLAATRDPLGRTISQTWCRCGALDALVDANGNRTTWERDLQGRVTREVRANDSDTEYEYGAVSGRLLEVTDPKGQVTTYAYFLDDALDEMSFSNATISTPSVSYTYDTNYPRLATMVDGTGTTSYTYKAPAQLGAGQVATVDGPLTDDTISYTYDELGRVVARAINSVAVTWDFDDLGRMIEEENVLGAFTFTYVGETSRPATVTYPNGQTTAYSYFGSTSDPRLQTIHHKYPGGATLSKFDYTYDAAGNILTWRQQADSDPAVEWTYEYDPADQLTAAVKAETDSMPDVLARYAYGYDPGGNRTFEQIDDAITKATHDTMNRLLTHVPGGALTVTGTVNEPATVTIAGVPVPVTSAGAFQGTAPVTGGTNQFTVVATDATGNVKTQAYEVDVTGQTKTFTYDANGNLTSDGTRAFEWDGRNQLVAAEIGTHRTEFTYDGLQRRVREVEKENNVVQTDTRVLWCDVEICEERSANGATVTRRLFALGEQAGSDEQFLAADHLGSLEAVTDDAANLLARYGFDPWGRRTIVDGTDIATIGYGGYIWKPNATVVLTLHRGYDPELGRWLSQDPLGLQGAINLLSYTENNPVRFNDPLGLAVWVCSRKAFTKNGPGNHSYFWNDRNGKCCGMGSTKSCSEKGPTVDSCIKVEGSGGIEEALIDCCRTTADWGVWFPYLNDCHEALGDCLKKFSLKNPGVPGGRYGPPCDVCEK